ncbi:MAG: hypothetical protein RBU24_08350 [Kiritimatiellia bacterium]|nr:hypothetical protein [Kiritimatiellia bacterium]
MRPFAYLAICALMGSAAAETPPTERVWPGAGVKLEGRQGATIEERGDFVYVQTGRCRPNTWPNVAFVYPTPHDLTQARGVRMTFTNCTDQTLRIAIKVKGRTAQDQMPEGGCNLSAHGVCTKELRFFSGGWVFDKDPHLLGLKRNPHVGGGSSRSLASVTELVAYISAEDNMRFGVSDVELVRGGPAGRPPTVLKADTFSPWVDAFGQANFTEWPDKVHSLEDFRTRAAAEDAALAARPEGIPGADCFGGWAAGPQLAATGFFRTEKVNGKWWLVDPDGRLFLSHGVNCGWECAATGISGRENYFEKLPPREGPTKQFWSYFKKPVFRNYYGDPANAPFWAFSFTSHNLWLKHGDGWQRKNAEMAQRRMRAWGLNMRTGGIPGLQELPRRIPYVTSIGPRSRPIEGADGYWGKLQDPFAPEFETSCRAEAQRAREWGTNEWCLGWTSNNEQSWGANGAALARGVLASPDDQPAKVALLKMLDVKGMNTNTVTDAVLRELGEAVADKYYATVRAAIKAVAPNHLYLGDRNDKRNPEVFRAAARHLDVITVNVYDFRPTVELPKDAEDKPFLVTEFHFGCYDTGFFYASLIPVEDQRTRAACYLDYLRTVVDSANYVGAHWFCWRDCPITGQLGEGANAQCGLVSTADVPYTELVNAIRTVSGEMYARRYGTLP